MIGYFRAHGRFLIEALFRGAVDSLLWATATFGLGSLPLIFRAYHDFSNGTTNPFGVFSYREIWIYSIAISLSTISSAVIERARPSDLGRIATLGSMFVLAFAAYAYADGGNQLLSAAEATIAKRILEVGAVLAVIYIVPDKIGLRWGQLIGESESVV